MKNPENQPTHNSSTPLRGKEPESHIAAQQPTKEEAEELIFSMTTHAMREPYYSREKDGIMAMTIANAREDKREIEERKRKIHKRLGPINARKKLLNKNGED